MSQLSIESFKRLIARFIHDITTKSSSSASLCAQCQPIEIRLKEIIRAKGDGFYGGGRDSTNTTVLGTFRHVLAHPGCPLCCLLIRLVLNLKQKDLFQKAKSSGTVPGSTTDLQNALLDLFGPVDFEAGFASGEEADDGDASDSELSEFGIEYKHENCFQVSVDAIPQTGAISVWLPLEQSDEVNDEESQLFMHPQDYNGLFGDLQSHISLPPPENGMHRNLELLRECYDYCNAHHMDCRRSRFSGMPSRLVDMLEMRVKDVPQGSSFDYVALSYVWGTTPFITLTSATLEFLRRPNSLEHHSVSLPKAIADAIQIGKLLGHRYIWIDSLCIKQDDRSDQIMEIRRMHDIYANAGLTIVAATGSSAQETLLDIEESQLFNHYHTIGGKRFCLDRPELKPLVSFTTWFTRGWTLQELNCSSKIVYFLPERTYYSCNTGSWNEDFPLDPSIPSETYKNSRDEDPKAASFSDSGNASECYVEMAEQLSRRQFTRDDDVLRAISGIHPSFDKEISRKPGQAKELLSISNPFLLAPVILCCYSRTYKVHIKNITGPELATRAGIQFFSILGSENGVPVGELKVDAGTLDALIGPGTLPSTAELLPIAELDFSSSFVEGVLYVNRYSRLGQFSQEFMQVVDQDADMSIVLWIVHQRGLYHRVALGYLTKAGLNNYAGQNNQVVLA
ncbi:heterokaryon incompatibility protein-domain-containing protein [Dactylonectria macrodidyma]|uniref:Heterokaryon incompatibility protein-domain-containing protein n=1 Tax=Dactylonectria macrodidyma TaxID=307937 RepID=A0A9P9FNS6_9HYPO|nr:heterokaryon incompatibility protein-domain-containing protein [Dactylonectria macrodidyma]